MHKKREYPEGLMVKIKHQLIIGFLEKQRLKGKSNTEIVEHALASFLGISLPDKKYGTRARKSGADYTKGLPVKISENSLIKEILYRRTAKGIPHCFTVEKAMLAYMEG
jgi:hypothetical protein